MKILLKERMNGLWLKPSGRWEVSRDGALEFSCGQDAIQRAEDSRPLDVQVCFEAADPNLSFELGRERGDFVPAFQPEADARKDADETSVTHR